MFVFSFFFKSDRYLDFPRNSFEAISDQDLHNMYCLLQRRVPRHSYSVLDLCILHFHFAILLSFSLFRLDSRRWKYVARRSILLRGPRSLADSEIRRIYSILAKEINHATRSDRISLSSGKKKVVYMSSIDVVSFTSVRIL